MRLIAVNVGRRLAVVTACMALIVTNDVVQAFKVDGHIYIAQEVLKDVEHGAIRVKVGNKTVNLPIPERNRRAILRHPEYFRMGSVGPDAYPDVLVGQMVIHPGLRDGWGAADWLHYLNERDLPEEQRAFVLGYLTHAAGDVFAHSYVNRYTGDLFDIFENRGASLRHVRLESFISKHMPPLRNRKNELIGTSSANVRRSDGTLAIPVDFVRSQLWFSPEALNELRRKDKAAYIPLIHSIKAELADALQEGGAIERIENFATQVALQITLDIALSEEDAKRVRKLGEEIHDKTDFSEESIKLMDDVDKALLDLHLFTSAELAKFFAATEEAIAAVQKAKKDIQDKKKDLETQIDTFENGLAKQADNIIEDVVKKACDLCPPGDLGCEAGCSFLPDITQKVPKPNTLKKQAKKAIDDLEAEISKLEAGESGRIKAVHDAINSAMKVVTEVMELKLAANKIALAYFSSNQAESPLRRLAKNWHDDIDVAMNQFVLANGESMINSITVGHMDPLAPYRQWFDCYGKGLLGIPILVTNGLCTLQAGVADVTARIEEVEEHLAKMTPVTDELHKIKKEFRERIERLREELLTQGVNQLAAELGKLAGIDLLLWKEAFTSLTDAAALNAEFSRDEEDRGLHIIPDIAQRVTKEMHLGSGVTLDPERFAPLRNAITLAKLAMLDRDGLNKLAQDAGLTYTIYGESLYAGDGRYANNVLYGFARNIDANHQWHRVAPPHPRRRTATNSQPFDAQEFHNRRSDPTKSFTYLDSGCSPQKGMRMWVDPLARTALFEKLFQGPLSPGVDLPSTLPSQPAFPAVLDQGYPNEVTELRRWGIDGSELGIAEPTAGVDIVGRGRPGFAVTMRHGSRELGRTTVDGNGRWRITVPISLNRAELLTLAFRRPTGKAAGSITTSFCNATTEPSFPGETVRAFVTVVKSDSLWRIADLLTGNGRNYVTLFKRNKHLVADQDMIFPMQVLTVPAEHEWAFSALDPDGPL